VKKSRKIEEIQSLTDRVDNAKAMIFAGYRGLGVEQMNDLRTKLREGDSEIKVVKNRLMKRVLKEKDLDDLSEFFTNPTAVASSDVDPVNVAKVLVEFAKANDKLEIKGGFLDGASLTISEINALAMLPSRDVLLGRALASMSAPATNFVGVLAAVPRSLVCALSAIKDTKEA
jgi:large subunit ribosomal protein L10